MGIQAKNPVVGLEHSPDGGTTWELVPGVISVDKGAIQTEEIDVTDADSTGSFREYIAGYNEAAEGSITLHNAPRDAKLMELRAAQEAGTIETFRVKLDGEYQVFNALVKGYSEPWSVGEKMVVTITVKLTGAPTYSAVS